MENNKISEETLTTLKSISRSKQFKNLFNKTTQELLSAEVQFENYTKYNLLQMYDDIVPKYGLEPLNGSWDDKSKQDIILLVSPFL